MNPFNVPVNAKWEYSFVTETAVNKNIYKLEENSPTKGALVFGLQTRRKTGNNRASGNRAIVNDDVFESAFLTLRQGQTKVLERIPLSLIEQATIQNPGFGYPIFLESVDFNLSEIEIENKGAIVSGEVIELQVSFCKPGYKLRENY